MKKKESDPSILVIIIMLLFFGWLFSPFIQIATHQHENIEQIDVCKSECSKMDMEYKEWKGTIDKCNNEVYMCVEYCKCYGYNHETFDFENKWIEVN